VNPKPFFKSDNRYGWPGGDHRMLGVRSAGAQQAVPVIVKQLQPSIASSIVWRPFGTLRANETVELTATVSETVTDVHFEDGQRVKAGSILVEMTNEEEHALIEEERSTVAEAKNSMIGCAPWSSAGRHPHRCSISGGGSTKPPRPGSGPSNPSCRTA
jgi:hypothetical protein